MANFRTHITVSGLVGVAYGGAAYGLYGAPLPSSVLAGTLCGLSGMLPDIDISTGRPAKESLAFAAAFVPMLMLDRMHQVGLPQELLVIAGALLYVLIRFGLGALLRRCTVHRGMFHSIPAALIAGELAFLLASGSLDMRLFKAAGVVLGYVTHLVLDEVYSVDLRGLRIKRSFGTAIKVFGHGIWPNLSTYAKLALLTYVVLHEPGWMEQVYQQNLQPHVQRIAEEARQQILR